LNFLITAGPTREFIDPVRFISNRSSGKMGFALAEAAVKAGHSVVLISGPVALENPQGAKVINVVSAEEMHKAVRAQIDSADVLIMCAAVSDYRPVSVHLKKMKKKPENLTLQLVPTTDILREIGNNKKDKFVIGFAAESDNLIENAKKKMSEKNLDMIVANPITESDAGFESDTNRVTMISKDGNSEKIEGPKTEIGKILVNRIIEKIEKSKT
jgi:phosphopantothenoylcysteine decarboxylase / phosphopantothenate---cysteine ligase